LRARRHRDREGAAEHSRQKRFDSHTSPFEYATDPPITARHVLDEAPASTQIHFTGQIAENRRILWALKRQSNRYAAHFRDD